MSRYATSSFSSDDDSSVGSKEAAETDARLENLWKSFDRCDLRFDQVITEEQQRKWLDLEKKHREYYWKTTKKYKGPPPTLQEREEYQESIPARLRAIAPAERRCFLVENGTDDYLDKHWGKIKNAHLDIEKFQYAWIEIIMADLQFMGHSLYAVRILLVYATALLQNARYQDAKKALRVLNLSQRAVDKLRETMKEETGDERWDLSFQDYKQELLTCLAFGAIGQKYTAVGYFWSAVTNEQQHRFQAMTEFKYKDITFKDKKTIENFEDGFMSVLHVLSSVLRIPRWKLDLSYELDREEEIEGSEDPDEDFFCIEDLLDNEEEDVWRCIEWLGYAASNTSDPVPYCEVCWTAASPTVKLMKCAKCHKASYCSKSCQVQDWKDHKEASCV